ncbi:flagellar hook-associated protein FlgK [Sansalvadorimonas sp. 2012CJ34-2]|uniref:Flagellar hook-associated protein 1 n=1 Tax=Parendozoicomonas callyspongiae TaxID=2942213 RepID=A0ABT0PFN6_9GAMM|nr:flagellar hook-associated protein FlgK [Sansalvadorimonas sp. 2012CJ34-2]MCL6269557.1 flagellar hook-associated protein FlgK [Sansalvadorimonas sp. 2012CJ34-2]
MSTLQNIGLSGLVAGRSSLDNTAQNVSNALTEWYSRRENILVPRQTHGSTERLMVAGVEIPEVRRVTDDFVTTRVWYTSGKYQQAQVLNSYLNQLDAILGGDHTGYSEPLDRFNRSLQRAAVNPEDLAVRQQVLGDARLAGLQLQTIQERLMAFHEQMDVQLNGLVTEVNQLAEFTAELNERIRTVTVAGSDASDLLDNRNRVIDRLAELAGVKVRQQDFQVVDVVLAGGEALVSGNEHAKLALSKGSGDPLKPEIRINNGQILLSMDRWSGMIGGIAEFRDSVLLHEQNSLGLQAAMLSGGCNRILTAGYGLDGNPGQGLFLATNDSSLLGQRVLPGSNTGSAQLTVTIDENTPENYVASDYLVKFTSATQCSVTRLKDKHTQVLNLSGTASIDGLNLNITSGTAAAGDTYRLVPWRYQAGDTKSILEDPRKLGFAGLNPSATTPADRSNGPGDNSNLQTLLNYMGGKGLNYSLAVEVDRQVSRVATDASEAASREKAEKTLRTSARAERDNLSGVNLDEEGANLIRFQQYYQANVRVMAAGTMMVDELLNLLT